MKPRKTRYPNPSVAYRLLLVLISIFIVAVNVAPISFFNSSASGPDADIDLMKFDLPLQETIDTFAADCTTPKTSFTLGETVCAKTDGVDLNFPGGRWVHWLRDDLSIAFGGSSTTLITANPQFFSFIPDQTGTWKVTIAETGDDSQTPAVFTVELAPESITTYDGTCSFTKTHFNVGDTVCAKVDPNFAGSRFIYWVNSAGEAAQTDIITSTSASATRVMTEAGNWWVYYSDTDGSLRRKAAFTISDPGEPSVDLQLRKNTINGDFTGDSFASYEVVVTNAGPDAAANVELTEPLPSDTTFVSSSQDSGPTFSCATTAGTTVCTIVSLAPKTSAAFTFVYQVAGGVTPGTLITNAATVTSDTQELHLADNTSTVSNVAMGGGGAPDCTLDCPNNIVTTATTTGPSGGATVTFPAAEGFGACGTITANPSSGSFFPIGTTTVTVSSGSGGGFCSFTVTVLDTAAPTIACPADITVTANAGQADAFVPDPNGAASNIGTPITTGDSPLEVTGSRGGGLGLTAPYPLGLTEVTWIVSDPSGRQATCTQDIRVLANQVLTISCPANVTVASPNGCDPATVSPGTPTSNSSTATIDGERSDDQPLNAPYPVGVTTITWTATDTDTQSASCTQTITVTGSDNSAPTLVVPPNINVTTNSCSVLLDDELGVATAATSCGTVSIARSGVPTVSCPTPQNPNKQCESFVFPTGTTVITYTATNSAGISTVGTQTVTVTESPVVLPTISCPSDISVNLPLNSTDVSTAVTYTTPVGQDNCANPITTRTAGLASGASFPVGTTTNTYRVTDASGNFAECSFNVTVLYNFTGFFSPVDNLPTLNVVNAGKAIPVKFSLSGNKGLNIFAANSPYTVPINCDGSAPQSEVEETLMAGGSSLSYTASTDQYTYVWKTENSWAGTCRQLVIKLNDGSEYRANFKFR